jgi:hypothetical protein
MSHRDRRRRNPFSAGAQDLKAVVAWLMMEADFGALQAPKDSRWSFRGLVLMALMWVWSEEATLTGRFSAVLQLAGSLWPRDVPQTISYQAFLKRLVRWTPAFLAVLQGPLRQRMQRSLRAHWQIAGRVVFGVDGSKLELARTVSNEARFAPSSTRSGKPTRRSRKSSRQTDRSRRKKADTPQLWITTFWHAGTGLPWDWRLGPSDSSERSHLLEMMDQLPPQSLITADAGFVGYPLWSALQAAGHDLLIRVGGNVRLLKQLGFARESRGTVYLWPDEAARHRQPPLVLRLVVVQGARHPWCLVTSVLETHRLSDQDIVEIYRRRWGIELFYRHFKQTFARRKLRSHAAEHVLCEAHWSLIGLWVMLLYAEQHLHRRRVPPPQMSVAGVLRAFRSLLKQPCVTIPQPTRFVDQLDASVVDRYARRQKNSRNYPRKKYDLPCGPPAIRKASRQQRRIATQLRRIAKAGLTA